MTTYPKLSIIVTSYNVQDYISEAIGSILAQSIADIEVIVVDDGSSDGTVGIIKSYAELDSRIKPVFFAKNSIGGVASAANAGLDIATGDYIGFADGDDVYDSEMFGKLHRAAVKHDADLAMCQFMLQNAVTGERVDSDDNKHWEQIETITPITLDPEERKRILGFSPVPWRKIYRREMIERNHLRFPVGDYFFEDNPFHWSSVLSARNVVLLPEVLCYHRMARPGQTMSNVGPSLFKLFKHHNNIHQWLMQNGQEAYLPLLLDWVAKQNAWISEKSLEEDLHLLLAELHPILSQYTLQDIQDLGFGKEGRTHMMLLAAKNNDLNEFSHFAKTSRKKKAAALKPTKQTSQHEARVDLEDIYFALIVIKKRLDEFEGMLATVTKQESAVIQEATPITFLKNLKRKVKL